MNFESFVVNMKPLIIMNNTQSYVSMNNHSGECYEKPINYTFIFSFK